MTTFLSKLGKIMQITGKVVSVYLGFAPGLAAMTSSKKDDQFVAASIAPLQQIAGIVVQVEAMAQALETPLSGPDKLKMATPMVAQLVLSSGLLAGKKIANPELFKAGCASIASGMADVLNSIQESGVESENFSD
jgi:hypothetical protein